MLHGNDSVGKESLEKLFKSRNNSPSLATYKQLLTQTPVVVLTRLPDIILENKSVSIEFETDSSESSQNDSDTELSNDSCFSVENKHHNICSYYETLNRESSKTFSKNFLKLDPDVKKEQDMDSNTELNEDKKNKLNKKNENENVENRPVKKLKHTESSENEGISEKHLVNEFLHSQIFLEQIINSPEDLNEDTLSVDNEHFLENYEEKPKLKKFDESDYDDDDTMSKNNCESLKPFYQNKGPSNSVYKNDDSNINGTEKQNAPALIKPTMDENSNLLWKLKNANEDHHDDNSCQMIQNNKANDRSEESMSNKLVESHDIDMPPLISIVDDVHSFTQEYVKNSQTSASPVKQDNRKLSLDTDQKAQLSRKENNMLECDSAHNEMFSELDNKLLIDESENCDLNDSNTENNCCQNKKNEKTTEKIHCLSELCKLSKKDVDCTSKGVSQKQRKKIGRCDMPRLKKQKVINNNSNNDIRWNKKLTSAEIKLLRLLPYAKNDHSINNEMEDQQNDKVQDYLAERYKEDRLESKQRPKHWISFKLHLQRQKFLRGIRTENIGLKNMSKEDLPTLEEDKVQKEKFNLENGDNYEAKHHNKSTECSTKDYNNRLAKEFPKHNWLPQKLQRNGYVDHTIICEGPHYNTCKFHNDNENINLNDSCNTKSSLNEENKDIDIQEMPVKVPPTRIHNCKSVHNKLMTQDKLKKCLKLCSYCMIACCREKHDSESNKSPSDHSEKVKTCCDLAEDTCKDYLGNQLNRKKGICLTNKQSNTPTVMVSPQRKTCITQSQREDKSIAVKLSNEMQTERQNEILSRIPTVQNDWKNNNSNCPKLLTPQQNWKPLEIGRTNMEKNSLSSPKLPISNKPSLTHTDLDSTPQMSQGSKYNSFVEYVNTNKKAFLESELSSVNHIPEKISPLTSNDLKLSENAGLSHLGMQDSPHQSNFQNPIKIIKYQTTCGPNKPQSDSFQKTVPMSIQEVSHPGLISCEGTQIHTPLLDSRHSFMNYAQRKKFIEAELDCQKRELQQIEYIMAQKERECKELMQLKHSKRELLMRIKHEQNILEQQQYHLQISLRDPVNSNLTAPPLVNQSTSPSERERILIHAKPMDINLQQQQIPELWSSIPDTSSGNVKQMWNQSESQFCKGFSQTSPYPNVVKKPVLFEHHTASINNCIRSKNSPYKPEEIPQPVNYRSQVVRNSGILSQNINRSGNSQLMNLLFQASANNISLESVQKNMDIQRSIQNFRKLHMPIKEKNSHLPAMSNQELPLDNMNLSKTVRENQFFAESQQYQNQPTIIHLNSEKNELIKEPNSEFPTFYANATERNLEGPKQVVQTNTEQRFENIHTAMQQQVQFQNYPITSQLLIRQQVPNIKSQPLAKCMATNDSRVAKRLPPNFKNPNTKESEALKAKCISERVSSTIEENKFQNQTETIMVEDDDIHEIISSCQRFSHKCTHCQSGASLLCSGCKKEWYCSPQCQISEWSKHSLVCRGC